MNEERYILARFIRELMAQDDKSKRENGYSESWNLREICTIIEQIRAEAVLGEAEPVTVEAEEVE